MRHIPVLFTVVTALVTACATPAEDDTEHDDETDYVDPGVDPDSKLDASSTVESLVRVTCSPVPVRGLSLQIAEELRCLAPDLLVPFEPTSRIRFATQAVLPYLEPMTAADLVDASERVGTLTVNSGLRSIAQQFLLHRWRQQGRCGIAAAASPGRSNHETGRAVDLANSSAARRAMGAEGFRNLANDRVHFDHLASPDLDVFGVEGFQRRWNRNHPEDPITEDGVYSSQTASRLARSPAAGFSRGARCD